MHELPLVQSIIDKASAHALAHGAQAVRSISLVVGDGTGYVPESIQMYFDIASRGTPCDGAILRVRRIRPQLRCEQCGAVFERKPFSFQCPDCGGEGRLTDAGQELYIEELEIDIEKGEPEHEGNDTGTGDGGHPDGERPPGAADERRV